MSDKTYVIFQTVLTFLWVITPLLLNVEYEYKILYFHSLTLIGLWVVSAFILVFFRTKEENNDKRR